MDRSRPPKARSSGGGDGDGGEVRYLERRPTGGGEVVKRALLASPPYPYHRHRRPTFRWRNFRPTPTRFGLHAHGLRSFLVLADPTRPDPNFIDFVHENGESDSISSSPIKPSLAMPALTAVQVSVNLPPSHAFRNSDGRDGAARCIFRHPTSDSRRKLATLRRQLQFSGNGRGTRPKRTGRSVVARFRNGLGGSRINSETARVLGNLAFAIFLTYLTFTGQLGWLLDLIVSVWLLAVLIPIVGIVAFLWWAGQDIIRGSCPNCGNEFQVLRSTLNDDLQLCPFCSQPFSVEDDEFIPEEVKFSNESTAQAAFFTSGKKGKDYSSVGVVDVDAQVRDAE